jgi:hypothetical protein
MILNFFTPLPPLPTDIANMSASVLRALGDLAVVRAWTSQAEWSEDLGGNYEIRRFDPHNPPIRAIHQADANFYNIGNDARYHKDIFDISRIVPGIQILHDTDLMEFFITYTQGSDAERRYWLSEMNAAGLARQAQAFLEGKLPFREFAQRDSLAGAALRPAIGAIVHRKSALAPLERAYRLPLFFLPLCLSHPLRPLTRETLPADPDRLIRIIFFGFIGGNRCVPEILTALADIPMKERYVLEIYGRLAEPERVQTLIETLDLKAQVTTHGFVSDKQLDAALAKAELAINLRNPTMGEASGSQLRIWENALPALVSDVGWYAELPAGTVFHIPPGEEIVGIRRHLAALRQDTEPYRQAGLAGRRVLEAAHLPGDYARGLIAIAQQMPAMFDRDNGLRLARRSGALLREMTGSAPPEELALPVAQQIHALTARQR